MKTNATKTVLLLISLCTAFFAKAQLNYQPGGFTTFASTYIDIDSAGIATPIIMTDNDSGHSIAQPIGFSFNFNGHVYDSFVMYVDGFIKLGVDTVSSANAMLFTAWTQPPQGGPFNNSTSVGYNPTAGPQDSDLLVPLGGDYWGVGGGTGTPVFSVAVTGSPGSQVCTIQWKNLTEKTQTLLVQTAVSTVLPQFDTINFQVKLYETSNVIEFTYGNFVPSTNTSQARFAACGIKGNNTPLTSELITLTKGSVASWGIAAPNSLTTGVPLGNYNTTTSNALNYGNNVGVARALVDIGRTFQFGPVVFNDLAVSTIQAMGKVALPCYTPDSIRVFINNPGVNSQSGVTVSLDITGANTFSTTATIPFIAGGGGTASVAFAPYLPLVTGENLITISVPSDDNNGNNSGNYGFSVTDRYFAYTDSLQPVGQSQGSTITMNFWGARYYVTGTRIVTQVKAYILANSNAEGDTVAGFVIDTLGNIIGRSPNYIVQAADLGTFITFNISVPPTVTNQSFIAGICGGTMVNPTVSPFNYYLGAYQLESPARAKAYYSINGSSSGIFLSTATVGQNFFFTPTTPPEFTFGRLMMECTVDPLPDNDVGVIGAAPVAGIKIPTGASIPLKAIVRNNGLLAQAAGLQVSYSVNGGPAVGPVVTAAPVNSFDTVSVDFTGANALNFAASGSYTIKIYTALSGDGIIGNDTFTITYVAEPGTSIPYRISNNILGSWSVQNPGTTALWKQRAVVQANEVFDFNVLWADNFSTINIEGKVISPTFNFSTAINPVLHFHVAHAGNTIPGTDDSLEVLVSTDGGFSYSSVYTRSSLTSSPSLQTDTAILASYTPNYGSDWRHETVNLSAFAGAPFVVIAFRDRSGSGNGVYIGNIVVSDASSISTQLVTSPSTYISNNVFVSLSAMGDPAGELNITGYNSASVSTASPVFATNTAATTNNTAIFTPDNVSNTEWHAITYSGITSAFPPSTVPYTVSFDLTGMPGIPVTDSLYIMKRANYDAPWVAISSTVTGSVITSTTLTGFSDFALGSAASSNPLPVNWLAFAGKGLSRFENYLSWSTASEENNDYFLVERSKDQQIYSAIQKVKSQGNSNRAQSYSFVDRLNDAATGNLYYRIKQVDANGKSSYSKVVTIKPYIQSAVDVTITNPFEGAPVIYFDNNLKASSLSVVVTDITGKVVIKRAFSLNEGSNEMRVDEFEGLKNGLYFTQIQIDENQLNTKKLLKVK